MKKGTLLIILFSLFFTFCQQKDKEGIDAQDVMNTASANGKVNSNMPDIKFEEELFDFGKITQGEVVSHDFKFKNTGTGNLIISGASGSCGCTVPKWPKEPVKPGAEAKLNVVFSSEGKKGYQEKTITVVTNCEPSTRIIRIKAEVVTLESVRDEGY